MSLVSELIVPVVVAIIAAIPAFLALRSAHKTRVEMQERRARESERNVVEQVYGQAYDRAQRINQEIVDGLRQEITRLQTELTDVRHDMSVTSERNLELERLVNSLERSVSRMSALLQQYGIALGVDGQPIHPEHQ